MTDDSNIPPDLEALDQSLRAIHFEPRESFGPELLGRLRHGERPKGAGSSWRDRLALSGLAASLLVVMGAVFHHRPPQAVFVDRCCYDLDGGGEADDGVTLRMAKGDPWVRRLRVYEDRDHSGDFSPGDVVRLDRRNKPVMRAGFTGQLVTIEHCCLDFDGGGVPDDALLVIGVPPDRVMMAAIYENPAGPRQGPTAPESYQLR
ncbi:MAG: hypothetical protein ACREL3_03620 [Gemmatimonadales bacterium]